LDEAKQFSIALDTAKGMAYLVSVCILFSTHHCSAWLEHSSNPQRSQGKQTVHIVTTHTPYQSQNILVMELFTDSDFYLLLHQLDSTWKAKVSDFGISRYQESTMTVGMGTFR
jgi:hypothetical protein